MTTVKQYLFMQCLFDYSHEFYLQNKASHAQVLQVNSGANRGVVHMGTLARQML